MKQSAIADAIEQGKEPSAITYTVAVEKGGISVSSSHWTKNQWLFFEFNRRHQLLAINFATSETVHIGTIVSTTWDGGDTWSLGAVVEPGEHLPIGKYELSHEEGQMVLTITTTEPLWFKQ